VIVLQKIFLNAFGICITWIYYHRVRYNGDLLALRPQRSTFNVQYFNSYRNLLSGGPSSSYLSQYHQEKQVQHPSPVSPPLTLPRIRSLQIRTISSAIIMLQCICGPLLFLKIVLRLFGMVVSARKFQHSSMSMPAEFEDASACECR